MKTKKEYFEDALLAMNDKMDQICKTNWREDKRAVKKLRKAARIAAKNKYRAERKKSRQNNNVRDIDNGDNHRSPI